jgi:hypothetical protein
MFKLTFNQLLGSVFVAVGLRGHRVSTDKAGFDITAKSKDFDKLLLCSVDDAFLSLGESARQSIYLHIEKNYAVAREEIPQNLEAFQLALEKIFGIASRYIEILIMKNLYARIGRQLRIENNNQLEFIKYVDAARKNFSA